jgi:hypothetical protein
MFRKPALAALIALAAFFALQGGASASVTNTQIASGPTGTVSTDSVSFTFTSSLDGGFECRLDGGSWTSCSPPQAYSGLADGPHRFEVRALNRPLNPDPTPAVADFTVRTHFPPETTIVSGPSGKIATDAAIFGFESDQAGSFECRLDSGDDSAWAPCASPQLFSNLDDGAHVFEVRAVNEFGEADPTPAAAGFATDTLAPQTTIVSGPSRTIATDGASFEFESDQAGTFECRLDDGAWAACTSPQSYEGLAEGTHGFEVRATDAVGNTDPTPAAQSFATDTEAPETTITAAPSGTIPTGTAAFDFEAPGAAGLQCRLDGGDWSSCESPRTYHGLGQGPHDFAVRGIDAVGNTDPTPASAGFAVDLGPPKPEAGKSFNVEPVDGTVELQCPGEDEYSRLTSFKQVPMGCLVNTRHGTISLTSSKGASGDLQNADFWAGVFVVTQKEGDNQKVDLKLAGKRMCEKRSTARKPVARASGKKRGGRRAWGSGKGDYETSGSYGSATVRGTTWLVVDRCDASTLFKVAEGTVWVQDFVKDKEVVLDAGEQYIAKAPIPRLNPNKFP